MSKNSPILIMDASKQPYLSLGCRFGGVKAFGAEYTYLEQHDAFLRKDHVATYKKMKNWDLFVEHVKSIQPKIS